MLNTVKENQIKKQGSIMAKTKESEKSQKAQVRKGEEVKCQW